jgi:CheY-like chemotaxis protein
MSSGRDNELPQGTPVEPRRVLIIDDEAAIGATIQRLLKPMPVLFAQSARGALGRIAAGATFAAILCDVNMPGMSGIQFYEAVAAQDPLQASRIVYVTGSGRTPEIDAFFRRTRCRCLPKPFEGAELRAAVLEALSRSRTGC